jgi:uncharacterized membrane protein
MEKVFEVAGRFHPVVVHLPIGILLLAALFIWIKDIPKRVLLLTLLLGTVGAALAVISGLLLQQTGDYDVDGVELHRNIGITVLLFSIVTYVRARREDTTKHRWKISSALLIVLIVVVGHQGGNLTHGVGYLTEPLFASEEPELDITRINIDSSEFYSDAVAPVLEARCYSCHGSTKQKGGLRLDTQEQIKKGGKNGSVINSGNPAMSELVKRMDLPLDDEDHMPPKERKQLTQQEKQLISLWIESGAHFEGKMTDIADRTKLSQILTVQTNDIAQLPDVDVAIPDQKLIEQLTEQGVSIVPVAQGSNFLQVNLISVPESAASLLPLLKPIEANIVSLKLSNAKLDKDAVAMLSAFSNLMTLDLSKTNLEDEWLKNVGECKSVVTLNLRNTKISQSGLEVLKGLDKLHYLNLYGTQVADADKVRKMFPNVQIEFGNYEVPALPTDTIVIKTN